MPANGECMCNIMLLHEGHLTGTAPQQAQPFSSGLSCCAEGKPEPMYLRAQRWASAFKADPLSDPCLIEPGLRLSACGDFCLSSSAEGAILSAIAAADAIAELNRTQPPTTAVQQAR